MIPSINALKLASSTLRAQAAIELSQSKFDALIRCNPESSQVHFNYGFDLGSVAQMLEEQVALRETPAKNKAAKSAPRSLRKR